MRLNCLNCGFGFDGSVSKSDSGWYSKCPECESSFKVNLPIGKIIMAFAWDETDEYFTDNWRDSNEIATYHVFDTAEEFMDAWYKMRDDPDGMWYWVLDDGELVCLGACDYMDEDVYREHWESVSIGSIL